MLGPWEKRLLAALLTLLASGLAYLFVRFELPEFIAWRQDVAFEKVLDSDDRAAVVAKMGLPTRVLQCKESRSLDLPRPARPSDPPRPICTLRLEYRTEGAMDYWEIEFDDAERQVARRHGRTK